MEINAKAIFGMARRWWWLLLLIPAVTGAAAYYSMSRQTPMYAASSTVEINPPSMSADTFSYYDSNLVATYQEFVDTSSVLGPFIEKNNLPYTEEQLRDRISTQNIRNTRFLKIEVIGPDPEENAAIANGIAAEFATFAKKRTETLNSPYRDALDQQIAQSEAKIEANQQIINDLLAGDDATTPEVAARIENLRIAVSQEQATYRELLVTANQMELAAAGTQTGVVVVQSALVPTVPYAPRVSFYMVIAAMVGLLIAVAAVALLEYLDNTVKVTTDYQQMLGAPLLSVVNLIPNLQRGRQQLFVMNQPNSTPAEAVRLLRTNVEFAAASQEIATLAVSSAGPSEGKSTLTANLGAVFSQAGFNVVIIDADLRRPSQQRIFEVPNDRGLTTLLTHPEQPWTSAAITVIEDSFWLIPSGPLPPNPADLLSGDRFRELIARIGSDVDLVLIDTPPVLAVSDPLIVSNLADATLLVSRANHTRVESLHRAANAFPASARLIGVVLNQQQRGNDQGYYYYDYYRTGDSAGPGNGRVGGGRFFGKPGAKSKPAIEPIASTASRSEA